MARSSAAPVLSPPTSLPSSPPRHPARPEVVSYGNSPPPQGAPVPPQELIGASIFVGLVSVLSISRHGPYLIALALGRAGLDPGALGLIVLNAIGFAGSLWLRRLPPRAWALCPGGSPVRFSLRL